MNDADTYPARLMRACAAHAPGGRVHVLDAGVPGYTSYQGRRLLPALLATYQPDVVTIAFGANDRERDPLSDADRGARLDGTLGRVTYASSGLALYRLMAAVVPRPAAPRARPLPERVDMAAFHTNVDEMIGFATRASARVVLVDLVFLGPFYRDVLQELSARWNVPLLDGRATLDGAFDRIVRDGAYREEAQAWLDFYHEHVVAVRPVYFDPDFYQRHYATDRQMQQFITLMADPIHPNAIGHHVLADALAPLVCPATR